MRREKGLDVLYAGAGMGMGMDVKPKYAILNQGVVLSRFSSKEEVEKVLEKVSNPKAFKLVRITQREVRQYYRRVNRHRKKLGLEPLNPLKW